MLISAILFGLGLVFSSAAAGESRGFLTSPLPSSFTIRVIHKENVKDSVASKDLLKSLFCKTFAVPCTHTPPELLSPTFSSNNSRFCLKCAI